MIKTRFAPSPTGFLHVGGARTALYSWLYAKQKGGKFVLRIEDTDQVRYTAESARGILDDLQWLGLNWDEGPVVGGEKNDYFQSMRLELYNKHLDEMIKNGSAYEAYESPDQLAEMRKEADKAKKPFRYRKDMPGRQLVKQDGVNSVVRFAMPYKDITVHDVILGDVTVKGNEHDDIVIRKSDGFPTYHFAVVVDDHYMGVTNILRAQEHLMNTFKHIGLYEAMGWEVPEYGHLPLVFNMDNSKMSKRDKEKAIKAGLKPPEIDIQDFRRSGYLPEVVLNFIALIGWSPKENREIMSLQDMLELFSISGIQKTNGRFDRKKLAWMNGEYIRKASIDRLVDAVVSFNEVTDTCLARVDNFRLIQLLKMYQPRMTTIAEMAENVRFFFEDPVYIEKDVDKWINNNGGNDYLKIIDSILRTATEWNEAELTSCMNAILTIGEKRGDAARPFRVAISGGSITPPLLETILFLGKETTLSRINKFVPIAIEK